MITKFDFKLIKEEDVYYLIGDYKHWNYKRRVGKRQTVKNWIKRLEAYKTEERDILPKFGIEASYPYYWHLTEDECKELAKYMGEIINYE